MNTIFKSSPGHHQIEKQNPCIPTGGCKGFLFGTKICTYNHIFTPKLNLGKYYLISAV